MKKRFQEIRKNIYRYIPFLITAIITLISILFVILQPDITNDKGEHVRYIVNDSVQFFGFGLIVTILLILFHEKVWKYVFSLLLLLAIFGLFQILNFTFFIHIGYIKFELVSMFILFFHLIFNKDILKNISVGSNNIEEVKMEKKIISEDHINSYIKKYQHKTNMQLTEISNDESYADEARQAARKLLENK